MYDGFKLMDFFATDLFVCFPNSLNKHEFKWFESTFIFFMKIYEINDNYFYLVLFQKKC